MDTFRFKQIELMLILIIVMILSNLTNDLVFHESLLVFNQMIALSIGYICIAKLLDIKKKWNGGMVLGQLVLLLLCASLYYSTTLIDFGVFAICFYSVVITIVVLKDKRNLNKEE